MNLIVIAFVTANEYVILYEHIGIFNNNDDMNLIVIAFVTANAHVILYEHEGRYIGLYSKI